MSNQEICFLRREFSNMHCGSILSAYVVCWWRVRRTDKTCMEKAMLAMIKMLNEFCFLHNFFTAICVSLTNFLFSSTLRSPSQRQPLKKLSILMLTPFLAYSYVLTLKINRFSIPTWSTSKLLFTNFLGKYNSFILCLH